MSTKIFNLDNKFDNGSIVKSKAELDEQKKKRSFEQETGIHIDENSKTEHQNLLGYQRTIEHMCGFYDLINYVSKSLNEASKVDFKKNIIYLDSLASQSFFMGKAFYYKYKMIKKGKPIERVIQYNPFITCKYDFIHFINWSVIYIYKNYLYFTASHQEVESTDYKDIPTFSLAVYCDSEIKFEEIFGGYNKVDLRKIKFEIGHELTRKRDVSVSTDLVIYEEQDLLENYDFDEVAIPVIEDKNVEKTIPLVFLNDDNAYLIENLTSQKEKADMEKLASIMNRSVDENMGKYHSPYKALYAAYKYVDGAKEITIDNKITESTDKEKAESFEYLWDYLEQVREEEFLKQQENR